MDKKKKINMRVRFLLLAWLLSVTASLFAQDVSRIGFCGRGYKDIMDNDWQKDINGYREFVAEARKMGELMSWLSNEKIYRLFGLDDKSRKFLGDEIAELLGNSQTRKKDIDYTIAKCTGGKYGKFEEFDKIVKLNVDESLYNSPVLTPYLGQYSVY